MYHLYDGKYRVTQNPISLNWLYNLFATITLPREVVSLKPGECVSFDHFKIVKVD